MLKNNKVLLCLDGEPPSKKIFLRLQKECDFIVAADGAANWLSAYGTQPDLLIGDLDGVSSKVLKRIPTYKVIRVTDQYSTDLEKAFHWILKQQSKQIMVVATAGKRIDHTLSNFSLLWKYRQKIDVQIAHDDWTAFLLPNRKASFDTHKGMTVSLIPYSSCKGITLQGLEYPLKNATMKLGEVGVSNVALGKKVRIEIKNGHMLAVFLKKKS